MKYSQLFSPLKVGPVTLKNRVVMAPMGTMLSNPDGSVSPEMYHYYVRRAKGGAGLIVLEVAAPDFHNSVAGLTQLQLSDESMIPAMSRLAEGIHEYGAKVVAQLQHAGRRCPNPAYRAVSASGGGVSVAGAPVYELTKEEIRELEKKFVQAAKNVKRAGLDGVELHAGHGYLINQFLSPLANFRTDEYGGSSENRARFLTELIGQIREACGREFLLSVRLAVRDNKEGGITPEEGCVFARMAEAAGVDMIHVTTGITTPLNTSVETQDKPEGNRLALAQAVKQCVALPVAVVGKLRAPEMCEQAIASGQTDLVTIGRQLICDPDWPQKAQWNREQEIRPCLSCSEGCYNFVRGVRCACNPYAGKEWLYEENALTPARKGKKIVVVGGGAAGMQAAVTAAERGHRVVLLEKEERLGGVLHAAAVPPHKEVLLRFLAYLEKRVKDEGVTTQLGCCVNLAEVLRHEPDAVLLAVGTNPKRPPVPGADCGIFAEDILTGAAPLSQGKKVVVIGGGTTGCETALYLHGFHNQIAIVEMTGTLSKGQQPTHRTRDLTLLEQYGIETYLHTAAAEITQEGVWCKDDKQRFFLPADCVVLAGGRAPEGNELWQALCEAGIFTLRVGSCAGAVNLRTSVAMGFAAAMEV